MVISRKMKVQTELEALKKMMKLLIKIFRNREKGFWEDGLSRGERD